MQKSNISIMPRNITINTKINKSLESSCLWRAGNGEEDGVGGLLFPQQLLTKNLTL